jgi:hypothetical protein
MRYYIEVSGFDNFEPNCRFFLLDTRRNIRGTIQKLEENPRYEFDLSGPRRVIESRFYLKAVGNLVSTKETIRQSHLATQLSDTDMVAFPNHVQGYGGESAQQLSLWLKGGHGQSMPRLFNALGVRVATMQTPNAVEGSKHSVAWALPSKLSPAI